MRQETAVDGFRLAYERIGPGPGTPAVLMLHGWPGDRILQPKAQQGGFPDAANLIAVSALLEDLSSQYADMGFASF